MPHDNEGYDIESRDADGRVIRYIEVNVPFGSMDRFWSEAFGPQYSSCQEKLGAYWLYVDGEGYWGRREHLRIQDPASKVVEYRFDEGWQIAAETETAPRTRSLRDAIRSGSVR